MFTSSHTWILFFSIFRLTRDKLEPLGIDVDVDKNKLVQSKKPSDRKAVKKAYQDAIMHRCRVTGENVALSGESSGTEDSAKESKHWFHEKSNNHILCNYHSFKKMEESKKSTRPKRIYRTYSAMCASQSSMLFLMSRNF